jgi:hypothetical protein
LSIADIRAGLVDALLAQGSLNRVYDYPPTIPMPPMAQVALDRIDYDAVMSGAAHRYTFMVRLYVGRVDDRAAVLELDDLLTAVPAAVDLDPSLGGACDSARVTSAQNYGAYQVDAAVLLGVEFLVDVIA